MNEKPFVQIKKQLLKKIPSDLIEILPNKWEKVGDVLILVLSSDFKNYAEIIGEKYAEVLNCKTVLNDIGGIFGEFRKPNVEVIFGSKNTETVHIENKIRFSLDPQKIMFSSGNMDERIRMAKISDKSETVVDLFAGIGYFTLPIAFFSKPKKIFACEKNTFAFNYLCQNINLNNVNNIVEPIIGDNREIAPKNVADRVIMGYFKDNKDFLPVAFNCLKNFSGFIHYHRLCPQEKIPKFPFDEVEIVADNFNRKASLMSYHEIKSYAPGISHVVLDVLIGEL